MTLLEKSKHRNNNFLQENRKPNSILSYDRKHEVFMTFDLSKLSTLEADVMSYEDFPTYMTTALSSSSCMAQPRTNVNRTVQANNI